MRVGRTRDDKGKDFGGRPSSRYSAWVRWIHLGIGLGTLAIVSGLAWLAVATRGCGRTKNGVDSEKEASQWPAPEASLHAPIIRAARGMTKIRLFVDPGHGAEGNTGNLSCFCEKEQDFTLDLAKDMDTYLQQTGRFEVMLSRGVGEVVSYPDRVSASERWKAHVFLSLHSDVRGRHESWTLNDGRTCPRSESAPGFSVLFSDEGGLATQRHILAQSLAKRMSQAGFLAYLGEQYSMYEADPQVQGVFADRHPLDKRIFVLRQPSMPSILVETHNAWDPREVRRWDERHTRTVFFQVVEATLIDFMTARPGELSSEKDKKASLPEADDAGGR
jgi:N-acetylmuramoyl-L-alanine amidase